MSSRPYKTPDETGSLAASPREIRVGELLNEFFDLRAAGNPITPDDFLSRHPDYSQELSQHFAGLGLMERLAAGSSGDGTVVSPRGAAPAAPPRGTDHQPASLPDIEGYTVLREIGRGGMGLVCKAVQRSTQRVVAIKLLLEGPFASEAARRRFEREIALAAQLKHNNIIPIYDSGQAGGRMFYAMEYVHGVNLADFVRDQKPSLQDRLRLFVKVCHAISHAHQRGVIHRDLKPSNILVDGDGEPRIHDFGLAKAGSVPDMMLSVTEHLVGTPAYMSPEQVAGDPSGIDIRTDIYSLGVILYELLTAQPPYDVKGSLSAVLNNIQHAEPTPPSKVNRGVDDEIETIVLKALEKRKEDRYQSVAELAADIERYLAGDPIQAKKASPIYLLRKVIMRHRIAAVIASLVVLLIALTVSMGHLQKEKKELRAELDRKHEYTRQLEEDQRQFRQMMEGLAKSLETNIDPRNAAALAPLAQELAKRSPILAPFAQLSGLATSQPTTASAPTSPDDAIDASSSAAEPSAGS